MGEIDNKLIDRYNASMETLGAGFYKAQVMTSVTDNAMKIILRGVEDSQNSLESIVSAFEEIRATSEHTGNNTHKIEGNLEKLLERTELMQQEVDRQVTRFQQADSKAKQVGLQVEDLRNRSEEVGAITQRITDVADRTNILAINASIEAARVGKAGDGFRIVANEVRNLAGQTASFANDIAGTISEFKRASSVIGEQMAELLGTMADFQKSLKDFKATYDSTADNAISIGQFLAQVTHSVDEQTEAFTSGLANLEQAFGSLRETRAVTDSLNDAHLAVERLLSK